MPFEAKVDVVVDYSEVVSWLSWSLSPYSKSISLNSMAMSIGEDADTQPLFGSKDISLP